jgi:Fe(3+) dicitrate transport protein
VVKIKNSNKKIYVWLFCGVASFLPFGVVADDGIKPYFLADGGSVIERVSVIGGKLLAARIPGAATYISKEDLEKFSYSDINRILRQVPGVNIQEEDGFGLRPNIGIRGTGSERSSRITLMEDGVLIAPAPYAAPAAYYFPTAGRLAGVEVRKGSSAIKFGPRTIGGAINLLSTPIAEPDNLQSLSDLSGFLKARVGNFGFIETHGAITGAGEQVGFLVEGFHAQSDGFKKLKSGDNTGFKINDVIAKLRVNSSSTAKFEQSLEFKFGIVEQTSNETYLGLSDDDYATTPFARYAASRKDMFTSTHHQAQATHFVRLNQTIDITTIAYYNKFERNWFKLDDLNFGDGRGRIRPSTVFNAQNDALNISSLAILRGDVDSVDDALQLRNNSREYYSLGVQSMATLKLDGEAVKHAIEFGVRYHEDDEDRLQNRENFAMRGGEMLLTSVGAIGSHANRVSSANAWAFFIQDEISFNNIRLIPGLRYETINLTREDYAKSDAERILGVTGVHETSVTAFIPGLGMAANISPTTTMIAGVHKGFSPPSPGKNDVGVEESVNFEAGFRFADNGLNFEAIAFLNSYSNLLGTCTNATGCGEGDVGDQFNGGKAKVYGIEGKIDYRFNLSHDIWMPVSINYNYTNGSFSSSFSDSFWGSVVAGDKIPYVAPHQLHANIGLETLNWLFTASLNYEDTVRNKAGSGAIAQDNKIPARTIVDLSLNYQVSDSLKLFINAENVFDKTYVAARRPYGIRPGKPRNIFAGIALNF